MGKGKGKYKDKRKEAEWIINFMNKLIKYWVEIENNQIW